MTIFWIIIGLFACFGLVGWLTYCARHRPLSDAKRFALMRQTELQLQKFKDDPAWHFEYDEEKKHERRP